MKYALIIGNNKYDDPKLAQLKTPAADSQALAKVLDDKTIGSFDEVTPVINQTETMVRRIIGAFLTNKKPDDLVLLYFSGHGILDDRGRLYLALRDTQVNLLKATSIPSSFVADEMDSCRSKRQILVLDCCHSGAFGRGTKGEQKAVTETTFEGSGFGRVVLTASDSTQYAFEGDQVIKQTELSLFTHFLLEGLKTGEADINNDGHISLDEWYDYTYTKVISETPRQVPHKWSYNQQGDLIIAKNPFVKKRIVELPYELVQALESQFVSIRESGVTELGKYLRLRDSEMVDLAVAALEKMKGDDSRRISSLAERLLAEFEQARAPAGAVIKVTPSKPAVEMEPETAGVTSVDSLAAPKMTAGVEPAVIRTPQPDVHHVDISVDSPSTPQKLVSDIPFWLKWIGIAILGAPILNLLKNFLSETSLVKSIPILFVILAGLASVIQWSILRNRLGNWWVAINVAASITLGLFHYFLNEYFELWKTDELFTVWVIGNFALGSILMWKAPGNSMNFSDALPVRPLTEINGQEVYKNISILLSIYLLASALVSLIIVFNLSVVWDAALTLHGLVSILIGISFLMIKEIPRNFGFIALIIYLILDGINSELYIFVDNYPPYIIILLLGVVALSSGIFYVSQRETWENSGFIMLAGYLISMGLAQIGTDDPTLYIIFSILSVIFALRAANFFFRDK